MLDDGICMGVRTFVEEFRVLSIEHRKRRGTVPVARSIPVAALIAGCSSSTRLFRIFRRFSPTGTAARRRAHRHREALWERVEAGSGSLGAASSESAAGSGRLRACGCSCCCTCVGRGFGFRFRLSRGRAGVSWVWMLVRFVCVLRVSACALVCPVCVPAPPGVFLPVLN